VASQTEHESVIREAGSRVYKMLKGIDRHDGVYRGDDGRRAGKPRGDQLKARIRRWSRAHDQVEIKIAAVLAEPLAAIVASLIDDDGRFANADRAKAVKGMTDQRLSADRSHRLTDAIAVGP
jgi:hypothetical protein